MITRPKTKPLYVVLLLLMSALVILNGCQKVASQSSSGGQTLTSSSNNKIKKVPGEKIQAKQLNKMISEGKSFSVFIYEPSCPPCRKEISALNTVKIKKHFYSLDLTNVDTAKYSLVNSLNIQYTPTILKVYKGRVVSRTETFIDASHLKKLNLSDPKDITEKLARSDGYSNVKDIFHTLSLSGLKKLVDQKSNFVMYVGRPTCSDCQSFEKSFMNSDVSKYVGKVYYLNVNRLYKNQKLWQQFKTQNAIQGTPAFVRYQDGKVLSSSSWSVSDGYSVQKAIEWLDANVSN